jgi:hypothetical protein
METGFKTIYALLEILKQTFILRSFSALMFDSIHQTSYIFNRWLSTA